MNIRARLRAKLEREEWHPVQVGNLTEIEVQNLLAMLWDEVWWHQLPLYRRLFYRWLGYTSPIQKFYAELWRGESKWQ